MEFSGKFVPIFVVLFLIAAAETASAATHLVGGSNRWDASADFGSWASSQTFQVGDELEFQYSAFHSVIELPNEDAYNSCDITSPSRSWSNGDSKIKLMETGTRFFACGTAGHCAEGMKVQITTVAATSSPPSSGATTQPSTPGANPSTSATSCSKARLFWLFTSVALVVVSCM